MSRRRPSGIADLARSGDRRLPARRSTEDNVREAAAWVIERTLASMAPVDLYLDGAAARFDERDQGLLYELVLGTLRWLRRLDQVIADAANRPFENIEPALRAPLRIAAYQLLFLDRVPAHAAVHEAVECAHRATHRGGGSFVNAVLRRIARTAELASWPVREADPVRRLAIELSHPEFLVARWHRRFGAIATQLLLTANNRPKPLHLLAFRDRGGRELLAEELIDVGLEVEPSVLAPLGLTVRAGNPFATDAFRRGDFYIQDEASQAAALLPAPRPGERILDAAAAPGGKCFALLAAEPSVRLVAADLAPGRMAVCAANTRRLGRRLALLVADAGRSPLTAGFDRVVVDLPCCGSGTFRKHPELKWRVSAAEIGRLADQGAALLAASAERVQAGGLLVAITCSLEEEENEQVLARFLETHRDFVPLPLADALPPPLDQWVTAPGRWQLPTGGDHDGFTVHVVARRAAAVAR